MRIDTTHAPSDRTPPPARRALVGPGTAPADQAELVLSLDTRSSRLQTLAPAAGTLFLVATSGGAAALTANGSSHHLEAGRWGLFVGAAQVGIRLERSTRFLAIRYPQNLVRSDTREGPCSVMECVNCPQREDACLATGRVSGALRSCLIHLSEGGRSTLSDRLLRQAKCLECLSIVLAAADARKCASKRACCSANACCLHEAASLLEQKLVHRHSLRSLALSVGTNEFTLKLGFRQLFQTTVFGYLREKRMDRARLLFEQGRTNVTEVAGEVGYTNISHFAAAFRRQFGVNPKTFVSQLEPRD